MYIKIIALIVGAAAIGGGTWYAKSHSSAPQITQEAIVATTTVQTSAEIQTSAATTTTGTLSEIMAKGGDYLCTFTMKDPNTESKGSVYISGKKFRGNFESHVKVANMTVISSSINDGQFIYTWTSASPMGFKVPVSAQAHGTGGAAMSGSMDFTAQNASTKYKCDAWKSDTSLFILPTHIQFMESPAGKK